MVWGTGVSPEGVAEVGRASGGTGAGDTRPGMGDGITDTGAGDTRPGMGGGVTGLATLKGMIL